ncbi:MAG: hypothetical protein V4660_05345 [Pseudomonadota bacterium]
MFLTTLGDICRDHNWVCYAYRLMSNHYHLLIEIHDANFAKVCASLKVFIYKNLIERTIESVMFFKIARKQFM